jgi:serine/threonine-protein phosphatase PGAM5
MIRIVLVALCFLSLLAPAFAAGEPGTRTIILVRHGEYDADPAANPKLGPGLSPLGVAQAHLVGARLAALPGGIDGLHVSPLQRARDTAATIATALPRGNFEVLDDLAECTPPTRRAKIIAGEKTEDLAACQAQLDRVFNRWFKPAPGAARTDLFVCHGNVIRYLVTRALGVDSKAWLEMSIGHASITKILVRADGSMQVISVGDVGHLPPNLQSGTSADPERSLAVPAGR